MREGDCWVGCCCCCCWVGGVVVLIGVGAGLKVVVAEGRG
jgi:hypothetical protein